MCLAEEAGEMGKKLSKDEPNIITIYHYLKDDREAIALDRLYKTFALQPNQPMNQHN